MKKIPMIALLIAPYAFLAGIYLFDDSIIRLGILALFGAVLFCNMIYAFLLPRAGFSGEQILFWNMLLKLCNIPFFLLLFVSSLLVFIVIIPLIPFLIFLDYLLLLSTTMYGISGMLCCYKRKKLSRNALAANVIAQFLFCADVFSAVYCYIKVRKSSQIIDACLPDCSE